MVSDSRELHGGGSGWDPQAVSSCWEVLHGSWCSLQHPV